MINIEAFRQAIRVINDSSVPEEINLSGWKTCIMSYLIKDKWFQDYGLIASDNVPSFRGKNDFNAIMKLFKIEDTDALQLFFGAPLFRKKSDIIISFQKIINKDGFFLEMDKKIIEKLKEEEYV